MLMNINIESYDLKSMLFENEELRQEIKRLKVENGSLKHQQA